MNIFSVISSSMLCCCIIFISFCIRIRFSRADSEFLLAITGTFRVSTLGNAAVSCVITLVYDSALFLFVLVPVSCLGGLLLGGWSS